MERRTSKKAKLSVMNISVMHLFLHKLKRCIIMATKWSIIDSNLSSEDCDFECFWSEWSAGEMVSSESDQRLLGSEIGSDHSLIMVWTMVWFWVWTMVWRWSGPWSGDGLIRTPSVWKVWSEHFESGKSDQRQFRSGKSDQRQFRSGKSDQKQIWVWTSTWEEISGVSEKNKIILR